MAVEHNIIAGMLPEDGGVILASLDKASAEGFSISHTTCCAVDETASYYIATLVRPKAEPVRRSGIGMGERNSRTESTPHVGPITTEKSESTAGR